MKLRHRIHILKPIRSKGTYGEIKEDLNHFKSVYAEIETVSGREDFESDNYNANLTHRITIRYITNLKPKYYIKYKNRYFKIEYIELDEKNQKYTYLLCYEEI